MTLLEVRYWIQQRSKRHQGLILLQTLLKAVGLSVLMFALTQLLSISFSISLILVVTFSIVFIALSLYLTKFWQIDSHYMARNFNLLHPPLQNSADLVLSEVHSLSALQQLQQAKVVDIIKHSQHQLKLPNDLLKSVLLLLLCSLIAIILIWNKNTSTDGVGLEIEKSNAAQLNAAVVSAAIESFEINITPPAYTQIKPYSAPLNNITIPEESVIRIQITFNQPVEAASIIISGKDSLRLKREAGDYYETRFSLKQEVYFQLAWKDKTWQQSDLYPIRITKDNSPVISITNLQQFTELTWEDNPQVMLLANLQDDYGLSKTQIIATVSKGSGESVKFREEKINFTSPAAIQGRNIEASTLLNLKKLGLEPGDELYFYIEAFDNKTIANRSRTDTYFIAVQDTSEIITNTEEGLGVDLMPEYFRSQRQIIIDTEKLINNKKAISLNAFKATSNDLGYDQKVLRLRYSEFMGEEFVSGIGPQVTSEDVEEASHQHDVVKAFGHVHDSENEHNLVEHKHEEKHDHQHETSNDPDKKLSPLEEFVHAHDDEEEATFYIQSVKAKLRAALTLMWDAELQLRLFEPTKSLPYQYKILKLLKEISNDSRIYVHRTGFDPPPIKEDKRYSADLSEITNPVKQSLVKQEDTNTTIQQAITLLQTKQSILSKTFTTKDLQLLQLAGSKMAALANEDPIRYLEGLKGLSKLINRQYTDEEFSKVIESTIKALWMALPDQLQKSAKHTSTQHSLDSDFIEALARQKND
jgi:hypothetical protein